MTEDRPYQRAKGEAEALRELRGGAGSQFDPRVVEAFVVLFDRAPSGAAPAGVPLG